MRLFQLAIVNGKIFEMLGDCFIESEARGIKFLVSKDNVILRCLMYIKQTI